MIIWRSNPGRIIEAYTQWASGEAAGSNAVVAYESMWGGTEAMARMIVEGLSSEGIPTKMFKLSSTPRSRVISELLEARAIFIGSATLNNGVLPQVAELLSELKGLRFKGRIGAAFGCFGWAGGGTKVINAALEQSGSPEELQIARLMQESMNAPQSGTGSGSSAATCSSRSRHAPDLFKV